MEKARSRSPERGLTMDGMESGRMAVAEAADGGTPRSFRGHQARAILAATSHYQRNDRGQLILPCGVGKTATAAGIREALGAETTLVLLPSLVLVRQFRDEWAAWRTKPYDTMCVCSDADAAGDEDAPGIDALGLRACSSTDPLAVALFLGRPGPKVAFSTYHSLDVVCHAARKAGACFDLAVCDEAHRTAGCGMRLFGKVHHDSNIRARKRLYMTATPRVAASNGRASPESVVYDMDDPAVFGSPFFQMTFRQAIDAKLLSDYSVVAIGISDGKFRQWMSESARCGDCGTAEEMAMNYALDLAMRTHGARRAISYHSRVSGAAEFADRHRRLFGAVSSTHVSGRQSSAQRSACLAQFAAAPTAVVSNARCLIEGFDLPAVDMVFFCDPKCSTIDVVQAAGRALRIDPTRPDKRGLIVLPVFHASTGELAEMLAAGDFRHVTNVLTALSEVDEVLKGQIALRSSKDARQATASNVAQETKPVAGQLVGSEVVVTGFDGRLEKALFAQVVAKQAKDRDPWQDSYRAMLEFRGANPGRWPDRGESSLEGLDLWKWRHAQRRAHCRGTLSDERRRMLDEIGLLEEARPDWLVQYQRLRSFRSVRPDRWPTKTTEHPAGNRLGAWCASQRRAHRENALSTERIQLLDAIGFPWGSAVSGSAGGVTGSREPSRPDVTVSV